MSFDIIFVLIGKVKYNNKYDDEDDFFRLA